MHSKGRNARQHNRWTCDTGAEKPFVCNSAVCTGAAVCMSKLMIGLPAGTRIRSYFSGGLQDLNMELLAESDAVAIEVFHRRGHLRTELTTSGITQGAELHNAAQIGKQR